MADELELELPDEQNDLPAAGGEQTATEEQQVPVSVVQAIRSELQELKDHNLILQAAIRERGVERPKPQPAYDPLADMDDDDIPTKRQMMGVIAQKEAQMGEALALQRLMAKPDFEVLIKEHWPNVLKADPSLAEETQGMTPRQVAAYAYRWARTDPTYIKKLQEKEPPSKTPEKVRENLNKPRSPATVGGTGSSKEPPWSDDPKEFAKQRQKVLSGG